MKIIDIIILVPLFWGAYKGFTRGLLMELAVILGFILATTMGFHFMDQGIQWIRPHLPQYPQALPLIAFLAIFLAVLIGVTILAKTLKGILDFTLLGTIDDAAGAIVGVLKWAFIISVIFWLFHQSSFQLPFKYTEGSVIYPVMLTYAPTVIDWAGYLMPFAKDLVDSVNELV